MSTRPSVITRTLASVAVLVVIAAATAACSSDSVESTVASTTIDSAPPPPEPVITSADPSTTVADATPDTSTTEAPTTTVEATTTTQAVTTTTAVALSANDLNLARNGVLPFVFGDTDTNVVAGLTSVLGATILDTTTTYTIPDGAYLLDAAEETGYTFPFGRYVCFRNDVCVQFGGSTTDTLVFTGWNLDSDAAPQLFTSNGISVGATLSAFPGQITVFEGGCYSTGYGETAGVGVTLFSAGDPFLSFTEDGEYAFGSPSPADVTVTQMHAGELPFYLFDDC